MTSSVQYNWLKPSKCLQHDCNMVILGTHRVSCYLCLCDSYILVLHLSSHLDVLRKSDDDDFKFTYFHCSIFQYFLSIQGTTLQSLLWIDWCWLFSWSLQGFLKSQKWEEKMISHSYWPTTLHRITHVMLLLICRYKACTVHTQIT